MAEQDHDDEELGPMYAELSTSSNSDTAALYKLLEEEIGEPIGPPLIHSRVQILCKGYSLALGALFGSFLLMSSMGLCFLYMSFFSTGAHHAWKARVIEALFTVVHTAIAFSVLHSLLSLLRGSNDLIVLRIERYLSTGAVAGISVVWMAKNYCWGLELFLWQTFFLFGVSLLFALHTKRRFLLAEAANIHTSGQLWQADSFDSQQQYDYAPLITSSSVPLFKNSRQRRRISVPASLGALVGGVIQVSSLAFHRQLSRAHGCSEIAFFAGGAWNLVAMILFVSILILIRRLLVLCQGCSAYENSSFQVPRFERQFVLGSVSSASLLWLGTHLLVWQQSLVQTVADLT